MRIRTTDTETVDANPCMPIFGPWDRFDRYFEVEFRKRNFLQTDATLALRTKTKGWEIRLTLGVRNRKIEVGRNHLILQGKDCLYEACDARGALCVPNVAFHLSIPSYVSVFVVWSWLERQVANCGPPTSHV